MGERMIPVLRRMLVVKKTNVVTRFDVPYYVPVSIKSLDRVRVYINAET
jgi:hypothetical protein